MKRRHQRKRPNPLKRGPSGEFPDSILPAIAELVKDQLALEMLKRSGLRDAFIGIIAPFGKRNEAEDAIV